MVEEDVLFRALRKSRSSAALSYKEHCQTEASCHSLIKSLGCLCGEQCWKEDNYNRGQKVEEEKRRFYSVGKQWVDTEEPDAQTALCVLSDMEQHNTVMETEHPMQF